MTFNVIIFSMVFFVFSKLRGDCLFCWYWWNCWPSLFKLSFHIITLIISRSIRTSNQNIYMAEPSQIFVYVCRKMQNRYPQHTHIHDPSTHIHDPSLRWRGATTSPLSSEIMQRCTCSPHANTIPTLTHNWE